MQFCANNTNNHILVLWQMFKWLEAACSFSVILEIESIDVELTEELAGNDIVATFCEVPASNKVSTAQMNACRP
jgi:hypothetical protein